MRNAAHAHAVVFCVDTLGIIGAGKVGTALGRLASRAGWSTLLAGSPRQQMQALIVETMVPDARLTSEDEVAQASDVVIVAVPFHKSGSVDWEALSGKVVVDAMNHWHAVDGPLPHGIEITDSTAEFTLARNPRMCLVKSFNHLGYHELETDGLSPGHEDRRGLGVASNDEDAAFEVARLVDAFGFEPVITPLATGRLMEPDGPVFGVSMPSDILARTLDEHAGEPVARIPHLVGGSRGHR